MSDFIQLHKQAGIRFSWGLGSGGTNIPKLIETAKQIDAGGALLAFEGPNEPNNWGIDYMGKNSKSDNTWLPIANLQKDLYQAVKTDPVLRKYPVWSISENGAEVDNVGLQFLTIPKGSGCLLPDGTKFADYANVHNYIYHPNAPDVADNKTWNVADPTSACKVDGLFGEYGLTWGRHFAGYSGEALQNLPRVTTETGTTIFGNVSEDIQAKNLLSLYLDQFARGWSYTCVYLLRDRVDEGGNQTFGFFKPDYSPRKAGDYLHNLTTILADTGALLKPGNLAYSITNEPPTVHHMLLQKSDGTFDLIVWGEKVTGSNQVTIRFGSPQSSIGVFDPTISASPVFGVDRALKVNLAISDHPLILQISPRR